MSPLNQRKLSMEGLESRNLMTSVGILPAVEPLPAETEGYGGKDYFIADSFSFGVEREMKESGEKGGTEDINIGVGELQECTVSKSMDHASTVLAQFAINGNSCGAAEIDFALSLSDAESPAEFQVAMEIDSAEPDDGNGSLTTDPPSVNAALLLPAVQAAREAARR